VLKINIILKLSHSLNLSQENEILFTFNLEIGLVMYIHIVGLHRISDKDVCRKLTKLELRSMLRLSSAEDATR
jgi:hypothetical protein